jgi:hypothetical protein
MTPEQAQFITSLPLQVVLLLGLWKVYTDGQADRKALLERIDKLIDDNERLRERVMMIEFHLGIDDPPTIAKRADIQKLTPPDPS